MRGILLLLVASGAVASLVVCDARARHSDEGSLVVREEGVGPVQELVARAGPRLAGGQPRAPRRRTRAANGHGTPRDHAFAAAELADMLERGTSRERSWALDALRSPSQALRDAVALRDAITRCAAPVRTSPAQAVEHVGTLVASLWVLEGSYVMRDVGISPGKGPARPAPTWWPGALEDEAAWLDDMQFEVLLRSVEHGNLEQVAATMRRLDAGSTIAVDVPGGCFTLTYVARSENGKFLTVDIAYRERDAMGLKYIPHARITGHDRGTLLLRPSQRIDGPSDAPAPGRMLMLSLEHVPVGEAIDLESGVHGAAR